MLKTRRNFNGSAGGARKKFKLLLGAAIATATLACLGSTYGLVLSNFRQNQPNLVASGLYQTLDEVPAVPDWYFKYGGATAFAPLRSETVTSAIKQAHPLFNLIYDEPSESPLGTDREIERLLEGEVSFVQSSRPLENREIEAAKELGFTLEQIPIAIDGIAAYVNPQLSIPGLTLSQLRDIFAGKIENWQEVDGPDLAITPFSLPQTSGTTAVFQAVMVGEELSRTAQIVETPTKSIRKVSETPGGIGYASAAVVANQETVKPLPLAGGADFVAPLTRDNPDLPNLVAFANGSYPLTRNLYVVIKRDGSIDERAGVAYANLLLSEEGQQLVKQAGFVPIRGVFSN